MAKNHVQPGKTMPYTNSTGTDIASGDVVVVNDMIGIALGDIADGESGSLALGQVWTLDKEADLAISQGETVYWDATAGEIDKTDTNDLAGKCFKDAAGTDTTVEVLVNA